MRETRTLCYILWFDSTFILNPEPSDLELVEMHTVGWLVSEDREKIVVAQELTITDTRNPARHTMLIPKVNIIHRKDREITLAQGRR